MALWRGLAWGLAGGSFWALSAGKDYGANASKSNFTMLDPIHVWIVELKTESVVRGVICDMVKRLLIMYEQQAAGGESRSDESIKNCKQLTEKSFESNCKHNPRMIHMYYTPTTGG